MLVLAGAGTGKTSVLVHRIARLIANKHAQPNEIRAFTFTHKAAREIRNRVPAAASVGSAVGLHASTFHGYCYELLREAGEDFQLLDQCELWTFLRQRVADLPLNRFLRAANPGRFLRDLLAFFDRCSDELITSNKYSEYVKRVCAGELPPPRVAKKKQAETMTAEEVLERCREISAIFNAVEQLLTQDRLLTFGGLVARAASLLKSDTELLARERRSGRFLLVDEFQDSNHAQIELTRVLAGDEQNVFAVGDPDQAIYHFRGASSAAFNEFVAVFGKLQQKNIVNLAENQRSTQKILDCAFAAIGKNPSLSQQGSRLQFDRQRLVSARDQEEQRAGTALLFATEPVEAVPYATYADESADIAERILELKDQGAHWRDFAVLFRSHANANDLVEALGSRDIPFEVQDTDLFDSSALRDVMAWLHCALSMNDDISLFRLILRFADDVNLTALHKQLASAERGTKVVSVLEDVQGGTGLVAKLHRFRDRYSPNTADLLSLIDAAAEQVDVERSSVELTRFREFARNWREKRISNTKRLPEFLEFLELYREGGGSLDLTPPERPEEEFHVSAGDVHTRDAVKLLTVHAAKGLEFKHVFVLRVVSNSFPSNYKETLFEFPRELRTSFGATEKEDKDLHREEERRLFYVAITRARDTLTLYGKKNSRSKKQTPSGYIAELLDDKELKSQFRLRDVKTVDHDIVPADSPRWIAIPARLPLQSLELSASAIEAYDRCPLKYSLQKLWRLPEEPSAALQYGSAMHTALKDFYDAAKQGRRRTAEETVEIFMRLFESAKIEEDLQRQLYQRQGAEQLRQFVAARDIEEPPDVVATEKPIRFMIEDVTIIGRIDRIDRAADGTLVVIDYKTGNPKNDLDASTSVQLGLYGLAIQLEGNTVGRMVFYNLEDNSTAETERINEQKLHETVLEVAAGIRAGRFHPKPGFQCNYCGYRSLCPATVEQIFVRPETKVAVGVK
jgi:DNA helicase-2/ATP-dependent DNA helicase PcrA